MRVCEVSKFALLGNISRSEKISRAKNKEMQ
jgi:hypothetical protein